MSRHYSDASRANNTYSLPDVEVFYADDLLDDDGEPLGAGWFYWCCLPGCLPDSDPFGPFDTEQDALDDMREQWND